MPRCRGGCSPPWSPRPWCSWPSGLLAGRRLRRRDRVRCRRRQAGRGALTRPQVRQVAAGDRAIRKLYSKEQRAFYAAHAPEGVGLDDLSILGPITVLKLKFSPAGYGRRLVAELWFYPDGSWILELSTKCAPGEGFQVAAETRAFLTEKGVDLYGEQQTKTKTALEYFSGTLNAAATS
jgi:hypothetical protein